MALFRTTDYCAFMRTSPQAPLYEQREILAEDGRPKFSLHGFTHRKRSATYLRTQHLHNSELNASLTARDSLPTSEPSSCTTPRELNASLTARDSLSQQLHNSELNASPTARDSLHTSISSSYTTPNSTP
ncbi:hypothetical protein LLEC1_07821 [Akanthomyces lecanii]|uniref:Uncharacterized protein n=1 Tax=Cordyceps confragosa TaxID=2714763 RepID=A0A179I910_CORDF|nr:hypothetical protein LLEC1_07821 [Akanthomyces lecanii]